VKQKEMLPVILLYDKNPQFLLFSLRVLGMDTVAFKDEITFGDAVFGNIINCMCSFDEGRGSGGL
jgi:hypothetical protein